MLEAIFSLNTLWWICSIIWFVACVALVLVVLLQKGKSSGFAGAFGVGGGSDAVFGPRGRKSAIVKATYIAAGVFMVLSLTLSMVVGRISRGTAPEMVEEDVASAKALDDLFSDKDGGAEAASGTTSSAEVNVPVSEGASAPAAAPEAAPAADAAVPAPAEAPAASEPAPAGQ